MENSEVRTRIAPSPTGWFHIGTARAALFNWLFARRFGGKFILRVEDTDQARSEEKYELDIMECLSWLGLDWDEGPETRDAQGPYKQSQRTEIYNKYADQLLADKLVYKCFCTQEELAQQKSDQETRHEPPRYSGKCSQLSDDEVKKLEQEGKKFALRFRINNEEPVKFKDLIKGPMEFDPKLFGDFIVVKSDGLPTFMFAGIIDDAQMNISHVIRGEDHLSNTPRQILLAKAMNLAIPEYGHLSMILNADRTKMSKRKNPVSVSQDFRDKGYLPEAMINFLILLGWSPKETQSDEIFDLKGLINEFDLEQVGKSPAIFDSTKLDYFNGFYIRKLALGELAKRALPYLEKAGFVAKEDEKVLKAMALIQDRLKNLSEVPELTEFLFNKPVFEKELLISKGANQEITLKAIEESHKVLAEENDFSHDSLESLLRALAQKLEISAGFVLWPLRVALSGKQASPGTFELLGFFQKEESLERIKAAINMLKL